MTLKPIIPIAFALVIAACGSESGISEDVPTDSPPVVSRVEPNSGPVGTEITVYGFGFSMTAPINIVIIGTSSTAATTYNLVEPPTDTEIESITATIPDDAPRGDNSVIVLVYDNSSNADITFTVTQ